MDESNMFRYSFVFQLGVEPPVFEAVSRDPHV